MSVGIKRSAMLIIMESSCTGKRSFLSGLKSCSSPSVSCRGEVVYVRRNVPHTSRMMRSTISTARRMPLSVMRSTQNEQITLPSE